jgi:CRISPR/Cas system-associated endoribonuclease Cas2
VTINEETKISLKILLGVSGALLGAAYSTFETKMNSKAIEKMSDKIDKIHEIQSDIKLIKYKVSRIEKVTVKEDE